MGAEPYWYFEKYNGDVNDSLQSLRQREFAAGRYSPVTPFPEFPPGPDSPSPGAQHSSIEEAMEEAGEEGTRSILDLDHVSDAAEFLAVSPLPDDVLQSLFGTSQPSREMVEQNMEFFEDIERGQGIYIVLYRNGGPDEVLFAGYSVD
jgi:hypothetical protein